MQPEVTTEPINRGQFLRSLGLSSGALMALYCMGTLTSCSSSNEPATVTPAPTPSAGTGLTGNLDPTKGVVDFTIDLNNTSYSKLKTEGEFVQLGQIVVANAQGTLVALSNVCTHQGGQLSYRKANNDFQCNVHAGLFTTTGAVKQSPPTTPVKAYKATRTGDSLRIVA